MPLGVPIDSKLFLSNQNFLAMKELISIKMETYLNLPLTKVKIQMSNQLIIKYRKSCYITEIEEKIMGKILFLNPCQNCTVI